MHDALACSRGFRMFNIVNDLNRKALSIEIYLNLPAVRVVRLLDKIAANRGYLVMDSGLRYELTVFTQRDPAIG